MSRLGVCVSEMVGKLVGISQLKLNSIHSGWRFFHARIPTVGKTGWILHLWCQLEEAHFLKHQALFWSTYFQDICFHICSHLRSSHNQINFNIFFQQKTVLTEHMVPWKTSSPIKWPRIGRVVLCDGTYSDHLAELLGWWKFLAVRSLLKGHTPAHFAFPLLLLFACRALEVCAWTS